MGRLDYDGHACLFVRSDVHGGRLFGVLDQTNIRVRAWATASEHGLSGATGVKGLANSRVPRADDNEDTYETKHSRAHGVLGRTLTMIVPPSNAWHARRPQDSGRIQ